MDETIGITRLPDRTRVGESVAAYRLLAVTHDKLRRIAHRAPTGEGGP